MKHTGDFHPRLEFEQPYWWLPGSAGSAVGTGFGPVWVPGAGAVVSSPAPTATFIGQHRRNRFTSDAAATPDMELGIHLGNTEDCHAWLGTLDTAPNPDHYRGGFYLSCIFRINALQTTASRFFCGYSSQIGGGIVTANVPPANTVGLWCATGDAMVARLVGVNAAGTATTAPTDRLNGPITLTAGTLYRWVMIQNPTANSIVTQLYNLSSQDSLAGLISSTNQGVSTTMSTSMATMMAPQCGLSNAANVGASATSLDIMSLYSRPNLKFRQHG